MTGFSRCFGFLLGALFFSTVLMAQHRQDSGSPEEGDSLRFRVPATASAHRSLPGEWGRLQENDSFLLNRGVAHHPFYPFHQKPLELLMQEREPRNDDALFYAMALLFLYYALVRLIFSKYHENLIKLFFRATLRQQQLSEQLLQTPLASFLLNLLFVVNGAFFTTFLLRSRHQADSVPFFTLFLFSAAGLAMIYLGKFIILNLFGWLVNLSRTVSAYLFIVFLFNKVAGIFLLPVLLLLAFPYLEHAGILVPFTLVVIWLMLVYRFWISYQQIRTEIKLNPFHFFIYLCAFEIAPMLVILKLGFNFVAGTG